MDKSAVTQQNAQTADASDSSEELLKLNTAKPTRWSIAYDVLMLILIVFDLTLIMLDAFLMSGFGSDVAGWLGLSEYLALYQQDWHGPVKTLGGFITIFLIAEVLIRWVWAIINKTYYRWFFFPFVHWYEVLGCFPQLRALRLLRAVAIGYGLYKMGYRFLPESWIQTGKFYFNIVMEEISDRVILIAMNSVETELKESDAIPNLIQSIIDKNRPEIQTLVSEILQDELAPALQRNADITRESIGNAVNRALANVPDLSNYLRMIPIAGRLIEGQIQHIGQNVAESIANEILTPLSQKPRNTNGLNPVFETIGKEVGNISAKNPALEKLVASIVFSSLETVREQIQVQQWKQKQEKQKETSRSANDLKKENAEGNP